MAFQCGKCKYAVSSPIDKLYPNVITQQEKDLVNTMVFTPCGHVFHLGCIWLDWKKMKRIKTPAKCPICGYLCERGDLKKMYPCISRNESRATLNVNGSTTPDGGPTATANEEPQKLFSIRHTALAVVLFVLVIQELYYYVRDVDKEFDEDTIEDDEALVLAAENPAWLMKYYVFLAIGMLWSSVGCLWYDRRHP